MVAHDELHEATPLEYARMGEQHLLAAYLESLGDRQDDRPGRDLESDSDPSGGAS